MLTIQQNKEQPYTTNQPITVEQIVSSISFPSTVNDWFNLDINTINSEPISLFKRRILSFICPVQSNIYNIFDLKSWQSLTRLCLGLSHLNEPILQYF